MKTPYKLLSVLLQYPTEEILAARAEIAQAVAALPAGRQRQAIRQFCASWLAASPTEAQSRYVETFDLQKRSSLYLSYYVHGDTRKRGVELVRLKRAYREAGLLLEGGELPDYLPVMLEFAELAPAGAGEALLREYRPSLELLRAHLREVGSPYLQLIDALCLRLPRLSAGEVASVRRLTAEGPPREQVGLEPFAPPEVMPGQALRR